MLIRVFVESGARRAFAGAIDWPGLARSGRTTDEALAALLAYVPRYKVSLGSATASLELPADAAAFEVVANLEGGPGTDFGVPSVIADFDAVPLTATDLQSQVELVRASWRSFEQSATRASRRTLATGPRGGGRSLAKIREHVAAADVAYISSLGAQPPRGESSWAAIRDAFVDALHAKMRGELPERGPRGGERWPARYVIRRSAWHALDHAWEIDDRAGA